MQYKGKFDFFNLKNIKTYPLLERKNKVSIDDMILPNTALSKNYDLQEDIKGKITIIAKNIISCREKNLPVVVFTGAHLIKNGLGLLIIDLIKKKLITSLAGNGATSIHDFELALIGQTSEDVPMALEKGQFGMSYEFCYINAALKLGNKNKLGFGEALGKMIYDETFRIEVLKRIFNISENHKIKNIKFKYPEISLLYNCYKENIPFTIHAGIGTDVIDQHFNFDGSAKGGCSGRDFLIYAGQISKLVNGGVVLNIGSSVTGPEVLLKSVSMAANIGKAPSGVIFGDFDLRECSFEDLSNESSPFYYFRNHKSVINRIPKSFDSEGIYVMGNQKITISYLYKSIINMTE